MLKNIDINKLNHLINENDEARQIIETLLENHQTTISLIAHEIRNPLTLISSSLQVMELQHPEIKQISHWNQTLADVEFTRQLLTELSSYDLGNSLQYSIFSIEQLLKDVSLSFAISLEQSVKSAGKSFRSFIPSNLGEITGDKIKLKEVFLNLLHNAKDAIYDSGSIQLTACRQADGLTILIQDTGCGIPQSQLDHIFEPFQTSKQNGTGLGLPLSKQIVEAHGGFLSISSIENQGTTCTIKLPLM